MPKLELPGPGVHTSFLAAMAEFQAEGRGAEDDASMVGAEIRAFAETWGTREGFAAYLVRLRAEIDPEAQRQRGLVPATTYWWVEGDEYLGRIAIRHELTDQLREFGGHIGYDVRPSARRQGHATAMLRAALTVCSSLGIKEALVTCVAGNTASRKVIERNGGVLAEGGASADGSAPASAGVGVAAEVSASAAEDNGQCRFWIDVESNKVPDISAYHAALPLGHRFEPGTDIRDWSIFPYELETAPNVRALEPPSLPEWARTGESGPDECFICAKQDVDSVWTDENWRISAPRKPSGIPIIVFLEPRGHWDMADLPAERSAELGPLFQRIEKAILGLDSVARVHIHRWGDGAAHLHWWFMGRPAGMPQLRGFFLSLWDVVLPPIEESLWRANLSAVAAGMAEGGGTAHC